METRDDVLIRVTDLKKYYNKGVIKALRRAYPQANIAAVDYDPGASEVNQLNRIKLMLSAAKKNAETQPPEAAEAQREEMP